MAASKSRAFSLVELLVVIAVIGILISLLLPAVQSAREGARRMQCRNNMKQVSLAVINYENAHKCYPPAGLCGPRTQDMLEGPFFPRGGQMISWVVLVLPFMEEQSLYQQFNLSQSVLQQTGDPQATPIKTLMCPSDETDGRFFSDANLTNGKRFAKGNYAAYVCPEHLTYADWLPAGLSGVHRHTRSEVSDGATKTLLLAEVRTRANEQDERGVWALPWDGATILAFDEHPSPAFENWVMARPIDKTYLMDNLPYHAYSSYGEPQLPNTMGANDMLYIAPDQAGAQLEGMPCKQFQPNYSSGWLSAAPRSRHLGGVNVTFLDGRVTFITDNIDEVTMAYLVSCNDGQNIDVP